MPLTLEQYATSYLDSRGLPWPSAPKVEAAKAKPFLAPLPVRAVMWNVYGTLLSITTGELLFEHPDSLAMDAALDKTIQEFKMWQSMSRKPGAPAAYMKELYLKALTTLRLTGGAGERYPEVQSEKIWDDIVKKLMQKEYTIDVALYGALNEYVKKVAYFFHASIQGVGAYAGGSDALRMLAEAGKVQGLLADGQCFTPAQIAKAYRQVDPSFELDHSFPADLRILSAEVKARKPSETIFKAALEALRARGISPSQTLHIGSSLTRDITPAKKHGMRTALFAGDKVSLSATAALLKDPQHRPDVLITELSQLAEVVS
jgi:FMN phosphatase YigB (HAD superfamily)